MKEELAQQLKLGTIGITSARNPANLNGILLGFELSLGISHFRRGKRPIIGRNVCATSDCQSAASKVQVMRPTQEDWDHQVIL